MNKVIRKLLSTILIVAMVVGSMAHGTTQQAQAAVNQAKSTTNYLNSSEKYLYLGEQGAKTYNFNIKKEEQKEGATYRWYVKTDKGNPDSVTINKKTGIVTAKEAGTAYIRCKITLADGTILRPEARVTVRNNITEVEINNLPLGSTITPDVKYDFNRTVLDTDAGKKAKTKGITRWEVKEDTAGVKAATSKGVVLPTKEGKFTIRAVCFQSNAKYKAWLADKEVYKTYITAESEWVTIYVAPSKNIAVASTQEQLNKLLKEDSLTQITLQTEEALEFTIPKGDYSNKVLIVNAANADVKNYGKFKEITIKAIKDNTWIEFSNGNIFYLQDDATGFIVDKDATVKRIVIDKANSILNIEVNGIVGEIIVLQPSIINITGSATLIPVTVEQTAGGSKITTAVPLKLDLKASAEITLNQGAEDTTLDKSASNVAVKIENNTKRDITITTNHSGGEVIGAGKTVISDGAVASNPTASQDSPSGNNDYYTVTYDSNGGVAIDAIRLAAGKSITSLPTPHKNSSIFLGWYTDSGYQNKFTEDSTVNSNLTLYARYSEIEIEQQDLNDSYALIEQNPGLSFTIISTETSLAAAAVKAAITLDIADGSEPVELTVNESNGTFLVTAQEGFTEGASYTLTLSDSRLSFMDKENTIRKCSFTIAKAEVYNIELNDDIIYIPDRSVENMTKDGASVESLSIAVIDLTGSGNSDVTTRGTFTYTGNTTLYSGDILCIYSGDKPEVPAGNENDASFLDDEIAYVKLVTVTGSAGSQVISYSDAEAEDVIFLPDVLPISLVNNNELNYTAATVNSDGSFTEELSNLNFSAYSEMGLSEDTTIDVGDYLAFYTGTLNDQSGADTVVYTRVTGVTDNNGTVTVTFTATTVEEMQEVLDYYSENDINGDEMLDGIDIVAVEKEMEQQFLTSGFAEEASVYLTALALETDGFKNIAGDDFELESFSVKMADGSSANMNEISLMAIPSKISIRNLKVKASIGTKLNKLPGEGVRCAVAVSFDVPLQTKSGDYIVISLSASFVEEIKLAVNPDAYAVWKKKWGIPYISDYKVYTKIDVYNFTGISFQAMVTSKQGGSIDISKEIQNMMSYTDSEQISAGVQNIYEIYSDMMENDVEWIEIFKQNIVTFNASVLYGIVQIRTTVDFVVSGEINMALGCNFEYQNGTRYVFWASLRARSAGSATVNLMDEVYAFQFYVMGSLGLRAGIRLEFAVGLFSVNLNSVGLTAEAGVYTRLYGYFYYYMKSVNKRKTSSMSGALLLDFGIYLEIAFKAQVLSGMYQYNPMLYEKEWPLLSVGSRYNVYDFAYGKPDITIKMKDTVTTYTLPDNRFNMTCLDLREGGIFTKKYGAKSFDTTFSNRNFTLIDDNTVKVYVPKGTRKMECDMTVTWRGASLAFSSMPIKRTFHLVWDDINDNGYTISYNSMGGSVVSSVTQRYESTVTAPTAPTKAGYTFSGWYSDEKLKTRYTFSTMPGENIVLYAKWTAKIDTRYQVEHYQQNAANDNYTLYETETLSGTTGTPATVTANNYTGFTYSDIPETVSSGIIEGEGSLVIKLYYDRIGYTLNFKPQNGGDEIVKSMKFGADISAPTLVKTGYSFHGWDRAVDATMPAANATYTAQWMINSYTIKFNSNGGDDVGPITQVYGTTLFEPVKPTKEGYLFSGWCRDRSLTKHFSFSTMPAENITLYARWYSIPNTAYKVEHYQQNILDEEYTLKGTENLLGALESTVKAIAKTYEGFTFNNSASNTVSSGILTEDGSLTLKLYYDRNTYTITFDSNEGSNVAAINQKYGAAVLAPEAPTKAGYIFGGWQSDKELNEAYTFSTMPAENITLYAKWNLNTDKAYKVEHYQQNILDEEYTLKETEDLTGTFGTTVTANAKNYEGFTINSNAGNTVSSGILTADGSLTLKLYYLRNTCTITFDSNEGSNVGAINQKYGTTVSAPENPTKTGYIFGGWFSNQALNKAYSFSTMPAENITLYAKWNLSTDKEYKVEHYQQNILDEGYTLEDTDDLTGTLGSTVTATTKTYEGFTINSSAVNTVSSGALTADGSLILKLYYDRNIYTITFDSNEGSNVEAINQKYGTDVSAPENPTKTGYTFGYWRSNKVLNEEYTFSTMPAENITLYAKWNANTNTVYRVEHYQQTISGLEYKWIETENCTGTSGSTVTASSKTYEGFNFNDNVEGTVSSGILAADGSLTLKLYYNRNYCTINYVSVGENLLFSREAMYGTIATRPQDDPTRLNFIFKGWYTDIDLTKLYEFNTPVTEDITLRAKWEMDGNEVDYKLWVGGVQVNSKNKDNIAGDGITGTISYEPISSTLTLNNATITGYHGDEYDIYAITNFQEDSSLTINVIGTNVINMPNDTPRMRQTGIYEENSLTIKGDSTASLAITSGTAYEMSAGLAVRDAVTIKGGMTVTATGGAITVTGSAIGYTTVSTGLWALFQGTTTSVTDASVLRLYGGNAETSLGYLNNNGYTAGVLSVSNGGKIIAAGNTRAMDGTIADPAQVYTGQSFDGSDKTIFSGDRTGHWCDHIKYVEATN